MLSALLILIAVFAACLFTSTQASALEFVAGAVGLTEVIAGALGTTAAVGGLASAIGGAIVGIGIAAAATIGAKMFAPKTASGAEAAQTPTGAQTSVTIGANVPRNAIVGPQATAGQLTYWNVYGDQNRFLQLVFTLGVGPHDDLTGIIVNGKRCTLGAYEGGGGAYTQYRPVTEFDKDTSHAMWVRFFNGFYDQVADQELVDFANPAGRWTTDNRGRGICYVSITLDYFNPEMWPQGIPQFLFELQGLRLYDRRLDSTNGGVGPHRWDNQHTWEYSDNPALALYLFERGLYVGSRKQLGRGLAPVDLLSDLFVAAANISDESVPIKAGGTEPRYRVGMNIGADRDWSSVEHDFCVAMSGWIMESAGAYGPIAGAAQTSVVSITDDDLIAGREIVYSQKRSRSELINTIFGTYTDPVQSWQMIPYPARASSADVDVDGAEFAAQRDYPMLFSLPQVQRAGEIERRLGRHQSTAEICLGFRFSNIEQGDWFTWNSARRDFVKTFQATRIRVDDDDSISLSCREISLDVFDFDETTDELDPLNPGDLSGINELITSVPDFSIEALQIPGSGGLTIPALHALWSPIHDQTVDEVYVEYRIVGTTDVKVSPTFTPANGEGIISDGIQAGTAYEARANIITTPIRETFWTDWVQETAPPLHVVPTSLQAIALVTDLVGQMFHAFAAEVSRHDQIIANVEARIAARDWDHRVDANARISALNEVLSTGINETRTVIEEADRSLAEYKVSVTAKFNDNIALVNQTIRSSSNAAQALAEYQLQVAAAYGSAGFASLTQAFTATSTVVQSLADYKLEVNASLTGTGYATLSQAFHAISDTAGSFAAYQVSVNTSFQNAGFTSLSQAFSALSDNIGSLAQYKLDIKASHEGAGYASLSQAFTVVADTRTNLLASYVVQLDVNGYVGGFKVFNSGALVSAIFVVDNFQIAHPGHTGGAPVPIFQVGTVNGAPKIGIRGDILLDGSVFARHVTASSITTSNLVADAATRMDAGAASASFNWDGSEAQIAAIPITSSGFPTMVLALVDFTVNSLASGFAPVDYDVSINVYLDSSLVAQSRAPARFQDNLATSGGLVSGRISLFGTFPAVGVFTTGPGPHTISVKCQSNNKGVGPATLTATIVSLEAKR